VIVDLVVQLLLWLVGPVLDLLPDHDPSYVTSSQLMTRLAQVDSFIPIGPVVAAAMVLMAFLTVFLLFRAIAMVRHLLLP
jgi:hypothetical protein